MYFSFSVSVLGVVIFAGLVSGVISVAACRVHRIHIRKLRKVNIQMTNNVEGHVHLLAESSEEEIP